MAIPNPLPTGKGYLRLDDFPLDHKSKFATLTEVTAYLSDPTCYAGFLISTETDPSTNTWDAYIVEGVKGSLRYKKIGSGSGGDGGQQKMFTITGDGTTSVFTLTHNFNLTDKDAFISSSIKYVSPDIEGEFSILPVIGLNNNNATITFEPANIPAIGTSFKVYLMAGGVAGTFQFPEPPADGKTYGRSVATGQTEGTWIEATGGSIITQFKNDIYIDPNSTATQEDGTLFYPYKSLNAAINAEHSGSSTTFHLPSGVSISENLVLDNKTNWTFTTDGTIGQFRTEINGDLVISGNSQRIGINNIQFAGTYTCTSTIGNIYMDNVAFKETTDISGAGYHQYDYCQFMNDLTVSGNTYVSVRTSSCEDNALFTINGGTLYLKDVTNATVHRNNGNLVADGITNFIKVNSFDPIFSIVSENTAGLVVLNSGFTRDLVTAQILPINLKGTATYSLGKFEFEPTTSVLNGTRIDGGLHSNQIYDHNTPVNYTPVNSTVEGHLHGIDNALNVVSDVWLSEEIASGSNKDIQVGIKGAFVKLEIEYIAKRRDLSATTYLETMCSGKVEIIGYSNTGTNGFYKMVESNRIETDTQMGIVILAKPYLNTLNEPLYINVAIDNSFVQNGIFQYKIKTISYKDPIPVPPIEDGYITDDSGNILTDNDGNTLQYE